MLHKQYIKTVYLHLISIIYIYTPRAGERHGGQAEDDGDGGPAQSVEAQEAR